PPALVRQARILAGLEPKTDAGATKDPGGTADGARAGTEGAGRGEGETHEEPAKGADRGGRAEAAGGGGGRGRGAGGRGGARRGRPGAPGGEASTSARQGGGGAWGSDVVARAKERPPPLTRSRRLRKLATKWGIRLGIAGLSLTLAGIIAAWLVIRHFEADYR